jgi:hypothetical protein
MPNRDTFPPSRRARRAAALAVAACLAAPVASAGPFGIPLERQPFVKICPDGTIVGSFGPWGGGGAPETIGASIYDPKTRTTTFIRRDAPDFVERLAANACVRQPLGRDEGR